MITPRPQVGPQGRAGWCANDLHPDDVRPLLDRFVRSFTPGAPDQCWLWQGSRIPNGYGIMSRSNRASLLAHRVSWVAFTGEPLLDNLTIDHLCNTQLCVNPDHLEPVTLAENVRRKHVRTLAERSADWLPRKKRRTICEACDKDLLRVSMAYHVKTAAHLSRVAA